LWKLKRSVKFSQAHSVDPILSRLNPVRNPPCDWVVAECYITKMYTEFDWENLTNIKFLEQERIDG